MIDLVRSIISALHAGWVYFRNRPNVTCDIRSVNKARWEPDWIYDEEGNEIASGIRIEVVVSFLLANEGPVDTTIKDIHINIKRGRNVECRLQDSLARHLDDTAQKTIEIGPRKAWGPTALRFSGSWWDVHEPTQDLSAELIVEAVAQQSVSKKIKLYF
jgi:hypothetical protein